MWHDAIMESAIVMGKNYSTSTQCIRFCNLHSVFFLAQTSNSFNVLCVAVFADFVLFKIDTEMAHYVQDLYFAHNVALPVMPSRSNVQI